MGRVLTHMTMSLDGFVAAPDDDPGELFEWYGAGEESVDSKNEAVQFQVDDRSAELLRDLTEGCGALIAGRRLFDIAEGWGDSHPSGAPVVVVTHHAPDDAGRTWPRTAFVAGVAAAVARAREIAGDKDVVIASGEIVSQALELGLVDEVCVSLVPVLFGEGVQYFPSLERHVRFDDPTVVPGRRALHLRYPVAGRAAR